MASCVQTVVLLVLGVFITKCIAQRSPTISYITQTQIKDIGSTVEVSCSVQYTQSFPVVWMKIDKQNSGYSLPISTDSTLIIHESRYSLRYDTASSTYTLQIKDIQETDAGFYQCQILISPSNRVSAEVELQVRRPPFISDNSTRSVVVSEGEAVELECYAGGFPPPKISWRRENNAILPTGGAIYRGNVLKIKSIRKEDRGTYYCVADNEVGRGTKRNIAVEVEFAPVVTVPRPRLGQALQYDMDLECHVEAYPPPGITWVKDDIALSNNQHYSVSHFATADEFTDTTLRVITIEKRQYGTYVCKAANKLGESEGTVELFEIVRDSDGRTYPFVEDNAPSANLKNSTLTNKNSSFVGNVTKNSKTTNSTKTSSNEGTKNQEESGLFDATVNKVKIELLWKEFEWTKKQLEEEHELAIKFAKEIHEFRIECLKEEHELRMNFLRKRGV